MKTAITSLALVLGLTSCAQTAGDFLFQEKSSGVGFIPHYLTPNDTNLIGFDGAGGIKSYAWPTGGGGGFNMGPVAYVSATNGNDGTGVVGNAGKPYQSVNAAIAAAGSGSIVLLEPAIIDDPVEFTSGQWYLSVPAGTELADRMVVSGATVFVEGLYCAGTIEVDDLGYLVMNNGTGNLSVTGGSSAIVSNSYLREVNLFGGQLDVMGSRITSVEITGTSSSLRLDHVAIEEGVLTYASSLVLDMRSVNMLGGIVNAAFVAINVSATDVTTAGDTTGQMLNVTGYGNCFACTPGGGGPLADIAYSGDAGDIVSGTVPTARLGSGTANSGTVLYGNNTWGIIPAPTLTAVLDRGNSVLNGQSIQFETGSAASFQSGAFAAFLAGASARFQSADAGGGAQLVGPDVAASNYTSKLPPRDGVLAHFDQIPTSLPPNGSAGGDLSGTYPNPTVYRINGVSMASLGTGIVNNTTGTGVPSIAVAADFPTLNQNTTGSAATLTTSRTFQTNLASTSAAGFNGSANNSHGVTGTLPVTNGGTGRATSTTAYGLIAAGTTATGAQQTISPGTAGQVLTSNGGSALASFKTPPVKSIAPLAPATVYYSWTDMPSAEGYFNSQGRWTYPVDLSGTTKIRVVVTLSNPGALPVANAKIRVKYKTEASGMTFTWSDYNSITSTGNLDATLSAAAGVYSSGWLDIASGAKAPVILAIGGLDGNGTADPQYQSIVVEYY